MIVETIVFVTETPVAVLQAVRNSVIVALSSGKGLPLACPVVFTQAERADPEVRRARNRVSGFNGGVTFGGKGILSADVLHRSNLGSISHSVLSFDLIFDSISLNAV